MSHRTALAAATACLLMITAAGGYLWLRGDSTPVSIDVTVRRYRESTPPPGDATDDMRAAGTGETAPAQDSTASGSQDTSGLAARSDSRATTRQNAPPEPSIPPFQAPGVYVYATTGHEHVDALGGSRHDYPPETTITVTHGGCGLVERWDPLEERWDERESCRTAAGDVLRRVTSYHEFFGQGDAETLRCEGFAAPADMAVGSEWTTTCVGDSTKAETRFTLVKFEDVVVDGKPVRAAHVHGVSTMSGGQSGRGTVDVWGSTESGLVLRERSSVKTTGREPGIGDVTYTEEYDLRLTSTRPRT